ncbi:YndJ family protein [Shouchella shacheensis]|uniref:YndJ family protein n=1 Tax=Shouchella shacheensis TaxID=1649580 RepID=UPI00073FC158|nr:YndJ family protein [Shouchella shacheensis]
MNLRLNIWIGLISMLAWVAFFRPTLIELALGFAFLLLVPLTLSLVKGTEEENLLHSFLSRFSFLFAWAGTAALSLPLNAWSILFASVWAIFTVGVALAGLTRLLRRGWSPIEETAIDVGFIYLIVGGGWFMLSTLGGEAFLPYSEAIVDLTAVHFHYAAFILPVLTGMLGRWLYAKISHVSKAYTLLAWGILAGPLLVAIGIDAGPPVEAVLVSIYVGFVCWFCLWNLSIIRWVASLAKLGLVASSGILLLTMALSFLYSFGLAMNAPFLTIAEMVRWHGVFNAFGFALVAVITWVYLAPSPRATFGVFPISPLRGRQHIDCRLLKKYPNLGKEEALIESWETFRRAAFQPDQLNPLVSSFHEQTIGYTMKAKVRWAFWLPSKLSSSVTRKMGQLNLPASGYIGMNGAIYTVDDATKGRPASRVWIRQNATTNEPIFTAAYSHHQKMNTTYMNIALPLPGGVMTGVLRPDHGEAGSLILTSRKEKDEQGDEGIYVTFGRITVNTPLAESFLLRQIGRNQLEAYHQLSCFGVTFVRLRYELICI